ncbi:hypothetical protein CY34DRAFT_90468 [Suillus luteus UH-Slu-Lm8-n1]|uniref:Uncharacterized protein n=1 Tax=Suillus luteus UH-Slu-Lm8-n1 TaxID=930992 RepID=A0A0C9ZM80_9AGAM|nr:hypothetical protein CY34DRAFT_90468 [Suillus luteus UH-Slu-Lm8-n1]
MAGFPTNSLRLAAVISGKIIILAFGYGFLEAVLHFEYLAPPNQVGNLWRLYPEELTMVVTLIATVLSVATTISVKEALRHRMRHPISLVQLSTGISLSQGSHIMRPGYLRLTLLTLVVYGALKLLTAGWTIILTPTYFLWPIQLNRSELDMSGSAFSTLLHNELLVKWGTQVQGNSFEVIDIGSMLSGVAAAGYTFGVPGIFNFNGAKYNTSTQGIVPTIEEYSGSNGVPNVNGTRLGFCGGNVTVSTIAIPPKHAHVSAPQGFGTNYSMWQQGLTADVVCGPINSSQPQYVWDTSNSSIICTLATQEYVTILDASGNGSSSGSGFLPSVICPGPMTINQTYTSFLIFTQGFDKYNFLNASVCEVIPKLTTVNVNYSNNLISSVSTSPIPFQSENVQLLSFIAGVAKYQVINSQGLVSSTIGDTLYSTYTSMTNGSINGTIDQTDVYLELEEYWCGVVEFSATFLRSGFVAVGSFPDGIPNNLSSQVNGTMYISTIGWTMRSPTYLVAILPLTILTILIFTCALYSTVQAWKHCNQKLTFDASNTLHLIMAAAGSPSLELAGFNRRGILANEGV